MKRSAVIIFGLLSALVADAASAAEVQFDCNYELGTDTSAQRRRIGSVVVGIDVDAKTARIDFGKGWFKPMTLVVDGTDVKETSPPSNGNELGYFYFDLNGNSGGFKSETDPHEFFDACTRVGAPAGLDSADKGAPAASPSAGFAPSGDAAAGASPSVTPTPPPATAQAQTGKPDDKSVQKNKVPGPQPQVAQLEAPKAPAAPPPPQAAPPAIAPPPAPPAEKTAPSPATAARVLPPLSEALPKKDSPPPEVHGGTEYFSDKNSNVDLGPVIKAPASKTEEPKAAVPVESASAPTVSEPPLAAEPGTTQFFGGTGKQKSEMPPAAFVAQMEVPQLAPSPAPPAASVHEAALESCSDTLGAEARSAKVNFENSSFLIEPASQAELKKIAQMMKDCGSVSIEVGGHADNLGDHNWNKKLSLYRANAVVNFLVGQGATASSLKAVGYGDEQPVATNDTDAGRRSNRRVELRVSTP